MHFLSKATAPIAHCCASCPELAAEVTQAELMLWFQGRSQISSAAQYRLNNSSRPVAVHDSSLQ